MSAANGNGRGGIIDAVSSVGSKLIGAMPSEFLGLVIITALFNLGMIWLYAKQGESRERVLQPLITACADSVPIEAIKILRAPVEH